VTAFVLERADGMTARPDAASAKLQILAAGRQVVPNAPPLLIMRRHGKFTNTSRVGSHDLSPLAKGWRGDMERPARPRWNARALRLAN
jgi:hypothetical protein